MRRWWYNKQVRVLSWALGRLIDRQEFGQTVDQELGTLAQLWEMPAVHRYLDAQEQYLKNLIAEDVISGKAPESVYYSRFMAGRVEEVRQFRNKLAAAFAYSRRKREEKALASQKKDS